MKGVTFEYANFDELEKIRAQITQTQNQEQQMNLIQQGAQIIQNMGGVDSKGSDLLSRFGIV